MGTRFRDDLYTTDYVMNMFSYDTFENEGRKKYKEDTKSGISSEDFQTNSDKTFKYNKTLTNKLINSANNYAYLGEVEYILYGNTNIINKANAYGRIFLLRYAFNVAPVFAKYWGDPTVELFADTISAATYGVIPAPLIKLAICLMINVAETSADLLTLRSGEGVKLIKGKDELYIEFPSMKITKGKDDKNAFKPRYSDYLSLFVFTKLASSSESLVYKRIADVIQVNMSEQIVKKKFLLKKAIVYYQISADIDIKPLMLGLEINQGENKIQLNTLCNYHYKI